MQHEGHSGAQDGSTGHYGRLLAMMGLSFVAMYALMYAMVNTLDNVFASVNQVYMAGLMTSPMLLIELLLMRGMYPNGRLNAVLAGASLLAGLLFFMAIRQQAAVGDRQFVRSMIPHHAGAILMCEQASIEDAEIRRLCQAIISGQQAEITQMKTILSRLDTR